MERIRWGCGGRICGVSEVISVAYFTKNGVSAICKYNQGLWYE